jgi:serine/threonine protein kinase
MWEIGTLAYELLFKRCPFERDIIEMMKGHRNTSSLSDLKFPSHISVSSEAKDFLLKSLAKNPL